MEYKKSLYYFLPALLALILLVPVLIIGDLEIVIMINQGRPKYLDIFFIWFTNLGNYVFGLILFLIILLSRRSDRFSKYKYPAFLAILSWIILDLILTNSIKVLVGRPRPYVLSDKIEPLGWPTEPYQSFPSGHTVTAFSFSTAIYIHTEDKWIRLLLIAFSVLMGFSRIYCGVHYPTDVIFGALIGCYGTLIIDMFLKKKD